MNINLKDYKNDDNAFEDEGEDEDYVPDNKEDTQITFTITDKAIEEIVRLYNEGRISINSDYQRAFIWDDTKQSRFIDSIFIGMPIPPLWLAKRDDREMEVIDGLQRITTIKRFLDNELKLKKMTFLELNDKSFKDIEKNYQLDFLDATLKMAIIDSKAYKNRDFIYELFKRINQNTVPLTKQELRNATYLSEFNNRIKKFAKNNEMLKKVIPDSKYGIRMKNIEMFYRFLSVFQKYNSTTGEVVNLASTDERVTKFMNEAIEFDNNEIEKYMNTLENAINKVYIVFGDDSFRKWEDKKFKKTLNVPLMEMQLIVLNKYDRDFLQKNKEKIIFFYKELFNDEKFIYSLRAATDSQENTNKRLKMFQKKIKTLL